MGGVWIKKVVTPEQYRDIKDEMMNHNPYDHLGEDDD